MFSFARIFVVAALAVSVLAAPEATRTTRDDVLSLNPVGIVTRPVAQKRDVHLTNAQLLSRGLPPNRPRARYGRRGQALQPRQSSTTVARTGHIQVEVSDYPIAFVSKQLNTFGEYQITTDVSDALSVSIPDSSSATFDIVALNGGMFDYLGFATGFANINDVRQLDETSFNYAYLAGVTDESRGPAVDAPNTYTDASGLPAYVESNVWSLGAGNELIPTWVNGDGTAVAVSLFYSRSDNLFAITGSADQFVQAFGSASHPATFKFVAA
ncbi:hypothetical protein K466DRAFT_664969 [Polyporus arcularius HHB13444]|uniref:Uncharacterized protein n=1 Tax=Polyporus arcularius HHB13444 TaxID=1314778 RepID=A0A5C3P883_9APHY|nr:hypothetical protein K466DRAFT_664969 [Polyporus arcularius HHB13444]